MSPDTTEGVEEVVKENSPKITDESYVAELRATIERELRAEVSLSNAR